MTAATLGLTVLAGCGGQQNKTQAEASKATGSQTTEAESSGVTSDVDLVDESAPTDNTAAALEDGESVSRPCRGCEKGWRTATGADDGYSDIRGWYNRRSIWI